ncbi:hypothetical protein GCM10010171_56900 [Actinokineospora fastidiosa]|uniref:Uncharacterized protein n=1 Tax=Actinokineospora fastidiosa TaxID=1816 RepID=A0A918GSF5_9PSEU|nr:hypothetical protein GCM10010171_56900 [Actinokineospora fastidiosa]
MNLRPSNGWKPRDTVKSLRKFRFVTGDGIKFRADFVARDPGGNWTAIETKTGSGAELTPGQTEGYPQLRTVGAFVDTRKLAAYGIAIGANVRMPVEVDLWSCPKCAN